MPVSGGPSDPLLGGNRLESTYISARDSGTGRAASLNKAHGKIKEVKEEKLLLDAFRQIGTMCDRIGLTKVVSDAAKQFYKKVTEEQLVKSKPKWQEAVMAACIYIACRQKHVTRTFKEICALTKVPKREIGRVYKSLKPLLEIEVAEQINIEGYVGRFGAQLSMPPSMIKMAQELILAEQKLSLLEGKAPTSIVAACLYAASGIDRATEERDKNEKARLENVKGATYISVPWRFTASAIGKVGVDLNVCRVVITFFLILTISFFQQCGCTEATLKNSYKTIYENRRNVLEQTVSFKQVDPMLFPPV